MKVLYIESPGKIEFHDAPIPVPREGEALLRIRYCGICGSDVATYTGDQPYSSYPRVPGHEFSAEIIQISGKRSGIEEGMTVTANPYFNCGRCYSCRRGKINCCENNRTMGVQMDGAFAQYITLPVERIYNGRGLPADTLAMVEPFSIGYHAVNRGNIRLGEKVLVVGSGPIGIFAMISSKIKGASVFVCDLLDSRLEIAKSMGADGILNLGRENLMDRILELTGGNGMDVCIEAVGLPVTFLQCLESVCFAGRVILVGHSKRNTTFNHTILLKKELDLLGSRNSLNDFEPIIESLAAGKTKVNGILTHVFEFRNAIDAFKGLKANDGTMGKVLIKFE